MQDILKTATLINMSKLLFLNYLLHDYYSASFLPMMTPIAEAIIRPLVQPLESPRQWSPFTLVLKSVSIFTLLL